jgi:hypothetical protein
VDGRPPLELAGLALLTLAVIRLSTTYDKAKLCQTNHGPQNCTISLHESINSIAYKYVEAATSLQGPFTLPNQSVPIFHPRYDVVQLRIARSKLCGYTRNVPARPDLAELCEKFEKAGVAAADFSDIYDTLDREFSSRIVQYLGAVTGTLEGIENRRWDKGEDDQVDGKDENARKAHRLRQDGHVARKVLAELRLWRERYAWVLSRLEGFDHTIRAMDSYAGYIVQGFEYEARRGGLNDK